MKFIYILLLSVVVISCDEGKGSKVFTLNDSEEVIELESLGINKNLEVSVHLDNNILNLGEEVLINLSVRNRNDKTVKILFENPSFTFGPWATTASLIDLETNVSKVKYANKSFLQSQIYSEEDLEKYYSYLKPGDSICGVFNLRNIIVLNGENQFLDPGSYRFQLSYDSVLSNSIDFIME